MRPSDQSHLRRPGKNRPRKFTNLSKKPGEREGKGRKREGRRKKKKRKKNL
jgi:hypothetical protein